MSARRFRSVSVAIFYGEWLSSNFKQYPNTNRKDFCLLNIYLNFSNLDFHQNQSGPDNPSLRNFPEYFGPSNFGISIENKHETMSQRPFAKRCLCPCLILTFPQSTIYTQSPLISACLQLNSGHLFGESGLNIVSK